jgi:uncharacterized protein
VSAPVPADAFPRHDEDVPAFVESLELPGLIDIHVHLLPHRLQEAVWDFFDRLSEPAWPVTYRNDEPTRLATLRSLGVLRHTALAYGHKPGVAAWCNEHTLQAAEIHPQVLPTFTFHAEDDAPSYVRDAIARGGRVAKVHLQVGKFATTDARLDEVWPQLVAADVPVVMHASAVYGVDGGEQFCGPDGVRALLERHPDLTVVVAHLGEPDLAGFLDLAEQVPTLRFDTAMVLTDPPFLKTVDASLLPRVAALSDRLLFGSDFPTIPHTYASQVRGLSPLGLDREALRDVLHDNAARLLGLPTAAPTDDQERTT